MRNDHGTIRARLFLLEGILPLAPSPDVQVEELTAALARCLSCHTEKEEFLLAVLLDRRLPQALRATTEHVLDEHQGHAQLLHLILELLATGETGSRGQVVRHVSRLIDALREHMATEEERLFPEIDRLLGTTPTEQTTRLMRDIARSYFMEDARTLRVGRSPVREEMTVHRVAELHPAARGVLRAFKIDDEADGHVSLEGLAARHGTDVDALVLALNQSVAPQQPKVFFIGKSVKNFTG